MRRWSWRRTYPLFSLPVSRRTMVEPAVGVGEGMLILFGYRSTLLVCLPFTRGNETTRSNMCLSPSGGTSSSQSLSSSRNSRYQYLTSPYFILSTCHRRHQRPFSHINSLSSPLVPFDSDMASPVNKKTPQPAEGTEFPPLDLTSLARR